MITIIIPTFNRPFHLRRLLKYYEKTAPDFQIYVGDSNNQYDHHENLKFSKNLANTRNINFLYNPRKKSNNVIETQRKILEKLKQNMLYFVRMMIFKSLLHLGKWRNF